MKISVFLRQKTLLPWDQIYWELWLQAHHMQKPAPVVSPVAHNKNLKPPFLPGYCWKFHREEKCSGCNFNHEYFKCGSQHPATNVLVPGEQQIKPQTCREIPQQQQLDLANQSLRPALSRPLSTLIKVDKLQHILMDTLLDLDNT